MWAFVGNLSSQISTELPSRSLILSCIRESSPIRCSRAHRSSGPVRYSLKNNSIGRENQSPPHFKSCEEKANRSSLHSSSSKAPFSHDGIIAHNLSSLDDGSQYQISAAITELEDDSDHDQEVVENYTMDEFEQSNEEFQVSNEIGVIEMDATPAGKTKQDAVKMAVEILATRAFTAGELQKKLHGKKIPPDIVKAVIAEFQDRGFLNDYVYAESFSQSKWHSLTWGPRRIKQALLRKGVSEADAEKAMKQVFENNGSDGNLDMLLGMSKVSVDHLLAQASKQWLRGQDVPLETRKSRIVRWLQYRGFNWAVTNFVLRKLESQYPP